MRPSPAPRTAPDAETERRAGNVVGAPEITKGLPAHGTQAVARRPFEIEVSSRDLVLRGLTWLGRRYLLEGLNRDLSDEVRLSGEVIDVRPLGVHATRKALIIRAQADARATLTIRRPDSTVVARRR